MIKKYLNNEFSMAFLNHPKRFDGKNVRALEAFCELLYFISLFFPLFIIPIIIEIFTFQDDDVEHINDIIINVLFSLFFIVYLNKDIYEGQSPMKLIMGYKIINNKTGEHPNEIYCLIRNLTILIWPLEAVFLIVKPSRRIGDYLINSKLINFNTNNNYKKNNKNKISVHKIIAILLSAIFSIFFLLFI